MKNRYLIQLFVFLFSFCFINTLLAAPNFPELTGRVVDDAHVLNQDTVSQLDTLLADYERGTTNQIVVVTLPTLQGYPIEDYGYQLGRYWKIGQAQKNNGVILLVAPTERKVRIEVGYGLEPILTDALSSTIVQNIILPDFRAGHLEIGIVEGTQAIVNVLGGKSLTLNESSHSENTKPFPFWLAMLLIIFFFWFVIRHPILAAIFLNSRGSGFGGGGGGGGFSGGGGGFGGGGASGSW